MDYDDREPISEWLTGIENTNKFVLDQLAEEAKQIPGLFTHLFCIIIYGALFWSAFESVAATLGLTMLPVLVLSYGSDRKKADIRTRRLIEQQNGLMRSLYVRQQSIRAEVTDCARALYKQDEEAEL